MNYQKIYELLIFKAQTRSLLNDEYFEIHHILPKCLGGADHSSNLVKLLPEEHYLAHQLLYQIHKGTEAGYKLLYALNLMSGKSNLKRNNKYYGWIKRRISESRKGTKHSDKTRKEISRKVRRYFSENGHHNKGKPNTEEQKLKISKTLKGRKNTWGNKISKALKGNPKSEEHKKKFQGENNPAYKKVCPVIQTMIANDFLDGHSMHLLVKKYTYSEGKIIDILKANNINPSQRTCIYCGKTGQSSNMLRWHFDNCKCNYQSYQIDVSKPCE